MSLKSYKLLLSDCLFAYLRCLSLQSLLPAILLLRNTRGYGLLQDFRPSDAKLHNLIGRLLLIANVLLKNATIYVNVIRCCNISLEYLYRLLDAMRNDRGSKEGKNFV